MNTGEWTRRARLRLEASGIGSSALEAQMLAGHVLQVDRSHVLAHPEEEFPELAGETLLQRRESGEPLAYILGWREFYGRRFRVAPGVLIPRHETETLIEAALCFLRTRTESRVLDLGTGSGCIAITLALESPGAAVTGSDVSPEALAIARTNADLQAADVRLIESDGFAGMEGGSFDLIVSNPPYIGADEPLPLEVRRFEPPGALFAGLSGLEFYERLADEAAEHLADGGRVVLEVGYTQAREVRLIFESAGWHVVDTIRDLSGVERVVAVEPVTAG